jgi:hypothetical protein
MATVRKGKTLRRRTKTESKQITATSQEPNGRLVHTGGTDEAAPNAEMKIEAVRMRAYELFQARGASDGDDLADWFNAEREILRERNS